MFEFYQHAPPFSGTLGQIHEVGRQRCIQLEFGNQEFQMDAMVKLVGSMKKPGI
jgi:hypothetical protein